jgi:hypothetical protein
MFDTWTSGTGDPYISITAHYVYSPTQSKQLHKWFLKAEQLAFAPFEGNHSGVNMSNIVVEAVEHYGIQDKVFPFHYGCRSVSNSALPAWMSCTDSACLVFTGYHVKDTKPCYLI